MTDKISSSQLEQFVLLAKSARGAAAVELIKQATEAPGVYVFGELLQTPNITELACGTHAAHYNLLEMFAYGTYRQYLANKSTLPGLSAAQTNKLRHLTIVSLATKLKQIPYASLLEELDLLNLRKLEDLIIEVVYADIVHGKLDQKNQLLEVDYAIGRDIRSDQVNEIINVLEQWSSGCESVLQGIEAEMKKADLSKETNNKLKTQIEQEVTNIKKTLKSTQQMSHSGEGEEQMITESTQSQDSKQTKKTTKIKGLRGSGKLWK